MDNSPNMQAVQADDQGALQWSPWPVPSYGAQEVLVEVYAAGVNRADLAQRAGHYPPPPGASPILGLEVAGRIVALGSEVTGWRLGDRVCALLTGGGYAEKVAVPQGMLMPMLAQWSMVDAAAVPEVFLTAYLNMFREARLQAGESLLVHAGASGVGTAAIQLAKASGCQVYSTAGSAEKVAACRQLGADIAVNYKEESFREVLEQHGQQVDVVLDMVGAPYFDDNLALLRTGGRVVILSTLGGREVQLNLGALMAKRLQLTGSTLRGRPLQEKCSLVSEFMQQCWPQFTQGVLRPVIDRSFPIAEVESAHAMMQGNENIGKLVLQLKEES